MTGTICQDLGCQNPAQTFIGGKWRCLTHATMNLDRRIKAVENKLGLREPTIKGVPLHYVPPEEPDAPSN